LIDQEAILENGIDDSIATSYESRASAACVSAMHRAGNGTRGATTTSPIRIGKCLFDLQSGRLTALSGHEIPLRSGEFELLKLFAENPNRPLSRDWLLETISHREMEPFDRAIDSRILRIRRKVEEDSARPTSIRTIRNAGYMFVPQVD
jgi:DNA-binding response OmpR family regulator